MLHITHDFTISPLMKTLATSHKHQTLIGIHIHLTFRFSRFWKEKSEKAEDQQKIQNKNTKEKLCKNVVRICGGNLSPFDNEFHQNHKTNSPSKKKF